MSHLKFSAIFYDVETAFEAYLELECYRHSVVKKFECVSADGDMILSGSGSQPFRIYDPLYDP